MKKTAKMNYIERLKDGAGIILHGFDALRQNGKAVVKASFSRLVLDSKVDGSKNLPNTYAFEIGEDGLVEDQYVCSIISDACPHKNTGFLLVQNKDLAPFYVESQIWLPDDYGEEKAE